MKLKNIYLFCVHMIALTLLPSCAHYRPEPLMRLEPKIVSDTSDQPVLFMYNVFTKRDCKKYLDRNVIAKGFQPIHVTFTNNSNTYFSLRSGSFSLPCASAEEVAERVHTSTVGRAVGYGVVGLFIWPFLIPAVVDSVNSSKANKSLDDDFSRKVVNDSCVLPPYSTLNGLIFVPLKSFTPNLTVTLYDEHKGKKIVLRQIDPAIEQ